MCGIIGYTGKNRAAPIVLQGLRKLEYRGYDSAGMASALNGALYFKKAAGKIDDIDKKYELGELPGNTAIAHTRWATHGGVTQENAHPHTDCKNSIAVVHNGIVDNYQELRSALIRKGHVFDSETDTEVIPHLIEEYLKEGNTFEQATRLASQKLEGSYAFIVISLDTPGRILAIRKDNPLVIGIGRHGTFAASDTLSLQECESVVFPDDGELAILRSDGVDFLDIEGEQIEKESSTLDMNNYQYDKGSYEYFMLKEIMEEPQAIRAATIQDEQIFTRLAMDILRARQVVITACGTSRYAALVGRYLFSDVAKKFCDVVMASEFEYFSKSIDGSTLVIAVSQSGETADVIEGIKRAKANGAQIVSIVNRYGSVLSRMSDDVLYLGCGPEVAVAATKSMVSQMAIFYLLAYAMRNEFKIAANNLRHLADELERTLKGNGKGIVRLAEAFKDIEDFYYVARGMNSPIASEAALKLKEISYIHAEGLPAGELKHGTLALIDDGTPVVVLCPNDNTFSDTISNGIEAKARGAYIIGVSDIEHELFDFWIKIPHVDGFLYPLISVAPLHLLAYYLALKRGTDPDKPRNLAKSVTVK
ncbi:MAG TPA: glutamine--fructose-6-phosphate transaminase (isomerizing) [Dehalococcoidia bacterium]|nr:glutamine--fructose-6-phosphate transaminase (isomerizing) [Dehalococcoidia bacterium]